MNKQSRLVRSTAGLLLIMLGLCVILPFAGGFVFHLSGPEIMTFGFCAMWVGQWTASRYERPPIIYIVVFGVVPALLIFYGWKFTMSGESRVAIQTESTVPRSPPFGAGDRVAHDTFGSGVVESCSSNRPEQTTVIFSDGRKFTVSSSRLKKE